MNYFAALFFAGALPATTALVPVNPAQVPTPPAQTISYGLPSSGQGIAVGSQVYQTMRAVASASQTAPSSISTLVVPQVQPSSAPTGSATSSGVGLSATSPGVPSPSPIPNTPSTGVSTTVGSQANQMIQLINQAREAAGLQPYAINPTLMTLARERAVALANGPFTSDMTPYGWPAQMEQAAGINAQGLGAENIAEAGSVSQAFALLMASPPHKANILNPNETQVGVGVAPMGSGIAVSELFIGPNN